MYNRHTQRFIYLEIFIPSPAHDSKSSGTTHPQVASPALPRSLALEAAVVTADQASLSAGTQRTLPPRPQCCRDNLLLSSQPVMASQVISIFSIIYMVRNWLSRLQSWEIHSVRWAGRLEIQEEPMLYSKAMRRGELIFWFEGYRAEEMML